MITQEGRAQFLEQGYLVVPDILVGAHLARVRDEFERVWSAEGPPCTQAKLLKHAAFLELMEHPPILDRQRAMFGNQVQLLYYELLRQGPHSEVPKRSWHRDFAFPGDHPLSINTLLFVDDITADKGPTCVIPGSHRGQDSPPHHPPLTDSLPGEVPLPVSAGSAIFLNSATWHSGGRNESTGRRRVIYLYFGYWWLKRYESIERGVPWQALAGASELRLQLLGLRMPDQDLFHYDPRR